MPNVACDTNVLYSALFYRGNEFLLVEAAASGLLRLYISAYILDELKAVLSRKKIPSWLVEEFVSQNRNIVLDDDFHRSHEEYMRFCREAKAVPDRADRPVYVFARAFCATYDNSFFTSGDLGLRENKNMKKHLGTRMQTTKDVLASI